MKHITKILCLSAGLLGFTACSDFLDQNSPSELTGQNVFSSTYYTGLTINKLYGDMGQDYTYSQYIPIVWSTNTDCELIDGLGSNATASNERGAMNYNVSANWANIARLWDAMYGIIENANVTIEGIENSPLLTAGGVDQTTMERYKGEALTIRAMVYFDLVRFFGDIPMKLESSQPDLGNAYLGKTDRDIIMDSLMGDLKEAIHLLPWAGTNSTYTTERVTKGYAHALLAQIALTRAGWAIREQAKEGYETAAYSDPTYPTQRPRRSYTQSALRNCVGAPRGCHQRPDPQAQPFVRERVVSAEPIATRPDLPREPLRGSFRSGCHGRAGLYHRRAYQQDG